MRFCDNLGCEKPDESVERFSDYRIVDNGGLVLCIDCYEQVPELQ